MKTLFIALACLMASGAHSFADSITAKAQMTVNNQTYDFYVSMSANGLSSCWANQNECHIAWDGFWNGIKVGGDGNSHIDFRASSGASSMQVQFPNWHDQHDYWLGIYNPRTQAFEGKTCFHFNAPLGCGMVRVFRNESFVSSSR